jgi:hypothetical protein
VRSKSAAGRYFDLLHAPTPARDVVPGEEARPSARAMLRGRDAHRQLAAGSSLRPFADDVRLPNISSNRAAVPITRCRHLSAGMSPFSANSSSVLHEKVSGSVLGKVEADGRASRVVADECRTTVEALAEGNGDGDFRPTGGAGGLILEGLTSKPALS